MIGFALKSAFWLTVVLLLLPEFSGDDGQFTTGTGDAATAQGGAGTASPPGATKYDALTFVAGAVADVTSFCERRQDACESGARIATSVGERVLDGAMTLADLLERERIDTAADVAEAPAGPGAGTLNPADLELEWREPAPAKPPIE